MFRAAALCGLLPPGAYRFANPAHYSRLAALAFALGCYRFARYRKQDGKELKLELPGNLDGEDLSRIVEGVYLARDLTNTPANDMGPPELEEAARALATRHGAAMRSIVGEDLITQNFPLIHAVGRAAARAPRLVDLTWGDPNAPRITLIGKGVCFDTGGLDIKTESGMLNMKKDMGGAASMLALAHMLMDRGTHIRLRVLIPAVENAISAAAFRPRDIYRSRKGLTVEIGNTDAEGRLILADAIALADEEEPELIADLATLTGAARVALGTDVPPFYTDDDALPSALARCATSENDPLWRMPLWYPYDQLLKIQGGGYQQCFLRRLRRLDHRRLVPAPICVAGEGLAALRCLRLEPDCQAWPAGRRRVPGSACALCARWSRVMAERGQSDYRVVLSVIRANSPAVR